MTFTRLTRGDWVAAGAALALLLVMAMDWYSTDFGEEARRLEQETTPRGATAGEIGRAVDERAKIAAEEAEKNAWQARPFADRVVLLALLAAIVLALAAAWLRAANKRFEPPLTPSVIATWAGLLALVLLAARIIQRPMDPGIVVKLGAPLGLVCVGVLTLGARAAWKAEVDGSAWGEAAPTAGGDRQDASITRAPDTGRRPPPLFDLDEPPSAGHPPRA